MEKDETENEFFFLCAAEFAEQEQSFLFLAKGSIINWTAFTSFFLWTILLISSIGLITTQTDARVRDPVEIGLEIEKSW